MCRTSSNRDKPQERNHRSKSRYRGRSRYRGKKDTQKGDKKQEKQVHCADTNDVLDCGEVNVDSVKTENERQSIMAKLNARPPEVKSRVTLTVKADTGANGNILPLRCLKQMYPNENNPKTRLQESTVKLTAVNGSTVEHYGTITIPLQIENSCWVDALFYVCSTDASPILSCDLSERLGIVKVAVSKNISVVSDCKKTNDIKCELQVVRDRSDLRKLYPKCFDGIGHFPNKYKITLKDDAIPTVAPPRKYPIQLKDEICTKLKEMENLGVIAKCPDDMPCDWVNSLAFSRKASGEIRICLDPRNLNKSIKRSHHKIPTLEEITHDFSSFVVKKR